MNKQLQIAILKKVVKKHNPHLDLQTIDFEAVVDSSLHLFENYENFRDHYSYLFDIEPISELELIDLEKDYRNNYETELLKEIDGEPIFVNLTDVINEIKNYVYLGEHYTFSTLFSCINGVSVLNYGDVGYGKSRGNRELLKMMGIPKVVVISGYITPKRLFRILKHYNDCLVIFDEADMLLSNPFIRNMFKSLLTSKKVVWETEKEELSLEFDGNVILNCNDFKFNRGIEDKLLVNSVMLTSEDMKKKIKQSRDYKPNKEIWNKIKDRIIYIRNNKINLTEKEINLIYAYIDSIPFIKSFRVKDRVFDTFYGLKQLFGTLNKEIFDLGKELSRLYISNGFSMLSRLIKNGITKKDLLKQIQTYRDCSIRTAYRIYSVELDRGLIKEVDNKVVVV